MAFGTVLTASLQLFLGPGREARKHQRWAHELRMLEATLDRDRANLSTAQVAALESNHQVALTVL